MTKKDKVKIISIGGLLTLGGVIGWIYNPTKKFDAFFKVLSAIGISSIVGGSLIKSSDEVKSNACGCGA